MSDYDHPYAPASGGQMSGTVTFGDQAKPAQQPAQAGGGVSGELISDTTTAGFTADVIQASQDVTVLVDFWAPWCGPCKVVAPILEDLSGDYAGKLTIAKLNIDENPDTPKKYGVRDEDD